MLAEADGALITSSELYGARGLPGAALALQARRAEPIALYRGDRRAAMARLNEVLRASPVERLAPREQPLARLILTAAQEGGRQRDEAPNAEIALNPGTSAWRAKKYKWDFTRGADLATQEEQPTQATSA